VKISPNTPVVYCDNLKKSCLQFSGDHTSNNLMILQKAPFLGYLGFSSALTRRTSMLASSQKHGNTCVVLCGCITCDLMQYHFQFISFPVIQATIFYCSCVKGKTNLMPLILLFIQYSFITHYSTCFGR